MAKSKEAPQPELKPTSIEEVSFDERDTAIFNIPDVKTKISTVQNYFFPRLEFLVRDALDIVQNIYEINPYERINFIYRPSNRKTAQNHKNFNEAHVGVSGKRRTDRDLTCLNKKGLPHKFHPCYLFFEVSSAGEMYVEMLPFVYYTDEASRHAFAELVRENKNILEPILSYFYVTYSGAASFTPLVKSLKTEEWNFFRSYVFTLPVDTSHDLYALRWAFIALYPLLDAVISIGEGEEPRLSEMLHRFKDYWLDYWAANRDNEEPGEEEQAEEDEGDSVAEDIVAELPNLDSYNFVRPGLWWSILARDSWTCCSCGRTAKDGVTLEVDHILPRSRGGTDDPDNLQTLCKKCNIGKSNKDSTDLR
jgi:hypothetical protein